MKQCQRLLHNHNKKVRKQERDLCCFENHSTKKKNIRAFIARPRQRNIYQITSPTTCNLHAYRQASEIRLNSFFISTTLLSFEQLIHLNYFIWRRDCWWRGGFLVASWLVAKLPGGDLTGYRDKG